MEFTAATWAAIAASFSALSSLLIWRVQHSNYLETTRPELVLSNFLRVTRPGYFDVETVKVTGIRNVGKGQALHVRVAFEGADEFPAAFGNVAFIPILSSGEGEDIELDVSVFWEKAKHLPRNEYNKYLKLYFSIESLSASDVKYTTNYIVEVSASKHGDGVYNLGGQVQVVSRKTTRTSVWVSNLARRADYAVGFVDHHWTVSNNWLREKLKPRP